MQRLGFVSSIDEDQNGKPVYYNPGSPIPGEDSIATGGSPVPPDDDTDDDSEE
jgi:hypothetical protein